MEWLYYLQDTVFFVFYDILLLADYFVCLHFLASRRYRFFFYQPVLYLLRLLLCLAHAKNDSYKGSNSPLVSW
jgi:hypothetical protein